MYHTTDRLNIDELDSRDPFEVDAKNWPHLFKHFFQRGGRPVRIGLEEIMDLYIWDAARYYPADLAAGNAHWLMVGDVEGIIVCVPLAPSRSGDAKKCRPIGIYQAAAEEVKSYLRDVGRRRR